MVAAQPWYNKRKPIANGGEYDIDNPGIRVPI